MYELRVEINNMPGFGMCLTVRLYDASGPTELGGGLLPLSELKQALAEVE